VSAATQAHNIYPRLNKVTKPLAQPDGLWFYPVQPLSIHITTWYIWIYTIGHKYKDPAHV